MPTFPNQCVWWAQTTEARNSNLLQGMCWEGGVQITNVPQRHRKQTNRSQHNDQPGVGTMKANSNSGDKFINGNCEITKRLQQVRAADT